MNAPRCCPILSVASIMKASDLSTPNGGRTVAMVPCAGFSCAMFLPDVNEQGQITGGACAFTVQAAAAHRLMALQLALNAPQMPQAPTPTEPQPS